jgi:hypothetical protein
VSLKGQLNELESVPDEDGIAVLRDVAERAKEVIPVIHYDCVASGSGVHHFLTSHR